MDSLRRDVIGHGLRFDNAFVVNALCCPSRASILTGKYSHSTGIWTNDPPHGGWANFDDRSTIATWLDNAGYTTGLVGKYLNKYSGAYIPPGWDHWFAISGVTANFNYYYDYGVNRNGHLTSYGHDPEDYSTDVFAREADEFIRTTDGPLFLYFAPWGPHGPPIPAPRHASAFPNLQPWRPPNFNEIDVSDKPAWVRSRPLLNDEGIAVVDARRQGMYRALLSVDEAVGRIVRALSATRRLRDTLLVFTSDNGLAWGEHRWNDKQAAYDESDRVPLAIRFRSPMRPTRVDLSMALNIDLAPTIADVVGVEAPGAEGQSLLPLLRGEPGFSRSDFLIEHVTLGGISPPTYCSVRTTEHLYVSYATSEEELYVLRSDPYQLQNRATDPGLSRTKRTLRNRVIRLCDPQPPGWIRPG